MKTIIVLTGVLVLWLDNGEVAVTTEDLQTCRNIEAASHHADGLLEIEDIEQKITNAWCIDVTKGTP